MIPGKGFEPRDLLNVLRRWPAIVIPFVVVTALGLAVVRMLPDRYRSETLIMVVPQRIPESYVRATVTTKIEDRLRSIDQQITTRTRLEPVIREFGLYPDLVRSRPMEAVVERMRRDIDTDIIRSDAFRISFTSENPDTAQKVTERLAAMYIEESLRDREVLADSTNEFLDSQLADAKRRLIDHEKKLEAYKMRFSGSLPAQVPSNLQVMQNGQLQIQSLVDSLNRDRDRRLVLQSQLSDLEARTGNLLAPTGEPVSTPAGAALAEARKTLDDLRRRLQDAHPDVVRQQRVVDELERRAGQEALAQAGTTDPRPPVTTDPLEAGRLARIGQIRSELASLEAQIQRKEQEEARLRSVVSDYQARVESAPARESDMTELMRDYDTLQHAYTSLLAKKEEAQVAANLERHQVGEQFKVLDAARRPEKPVTPNRPLFNAIAAAAGLGAGLLVAFLLEYRDTSIKSDEDVVAVLTLPVLAVIPELKPFASPRDGRRWWPSRSQHGLPDSRTSSRSTLGVR